MRCFNPLILLCIICLFLVCCGGGKGSASSAAAPATPAPAVETYIPPPPRPGMSEVYSVVYNAGEVTLTGTGFGTKTTPTPAYFNDFESETIGNIPSDQITNIADFGTTQANVARGTKSLEFFYDTYGGATAGVDKMDWKRNAVDLGTGKDKIYISAWVYLDKGASTCTSWQWKSFTITSSPQLYYDLSTTWPNTNLPYSAYAYNTTDTFVTYWWLSSGRWGNTHANVYYYDYSTLANKSGMAAVGLPSDALLWNQWQRLEFYGQRSSAAGVADGIFRELRVDRIISTFEKTNAITHLTGNDPWRYVVLSHALESAYDGFMNLYIYMDDVYIDTTQARVEIGDNPVWGLCTHREIQIPTSWSPTQIKVNFRKGSFNSGQTVYFFVVDDNDNVNRVGGSFVVP